MDVTAILQSPLIGLISLAVPQAAPVIAILQRFAPAIGAGADLVQAAVREGIPAFEAAKEQAPELAAAAERIFAQVKSHLPAGLEAPDFHLENFTRMLAGMPAEEKAWMDNATPGNDPSQENSKYTAG